MTTTLRLNKPQTRALRSLSPRTTLCLAWGRGVGKSWFLRLACYLLISEWEGKPRTNQLGKVFRGIRIVLVGPTIEQLKKVHGKDFDDELGPGGDWEHLGAKISHDSGGWRISFPGGSWIQWVTAERARGARGLRCDMAIFDEADDINMDVYDAVSVPWFSGPESLRINVLAGTPTKGRQGLLYRTYVRGVEKTPGHVSIHATWRDAPDTVSVDQVESARRDMPAAYFKREWECDFDSAEGLVYPDFSTSLHVRKPHPNATPTEIVIGVDFGFVDPTAFIAVALYGSGADTIAWCIREYYESGKILEDWVTEAKEWQRRWPKAKWYADPSQPATIESLRRGACIDIEAADNDRDDGIFTVNHWLTPKVREVGGIKEQQIYLFVDPDCKNLIREFGLYRRKRDAKNKDRILEKIEDKDDHLQDSLRYALFSRFGLPPAIRIESGQGR